MELYLDRASFPSFWISPDVNLFDTPINRIVKKARHQRCNSGKVSPYQDQSCLLKLKSTLKTITRKQSPNSSAKFKKTPYKSSIFNITKPSLPLPKPSKKKVLKANKKKKNKLLNEKLTILNKKECKLAPKIFENQLFSDIYDDKGNHDRVMDTFNISQSRTRIDDDSFICNAKLIIASNAEMEEEETEHKSHVKQPDNSFLADTERKIKSNHLELFQKLQNLAAERSWDDDEL